MPLLLVIVLLLTASPVAAESWDGYVVGVEDANTIRISRKPDSREAEYVLRFYGIGAPTLRQPLGNEALAYLRRTLPAGSRVGVEIVGDDKDGSKLALVQAHGQSVNYQLLAQGLAWVDRQACKAIFCRRWYIQEHYAVKERRGLWQLNLGTPPWQWGR